MVSIPDALRDSVITPKIASCAPACIVESWEYRTQGLGPRASVFGSRVLGQRRVQLRLGCRV